MILPPFWKTKLPVSLRSKLNATYDESFLLLLCRSIFNHLYKKIRFSYQERLK